MLSEAFGGSETGTFRDMMRFLGLAFGLAFYDQRSNRKLTQFLSGGPYGYSRGEIDAWADFRHPLSHADRKKTTLIAMTRDIRPVLMRLKQACLDVLFNKQDWGNPSNVRRDVWRPDAFTTSPSGSIVTKRATRLGLLFRTYDEFGRYPRKLDLSIDHSVTGFFGKYLSTHDPRPLAEFAVRVCADQVAKRREGR